MEMEIEAGMETEKGDLNNISAALELGL